MDWNDAKDMPPRREPVWPTVRARSDVAHYHLVLALDSMPFLAWEGEPTTLVSWYAQTEAAYFVLMGLIQRLRGHEALAGLSHVYMAYSLLNRWMTPALPSLLPPEGELYRIGVFPLPSVCIPRLREIVAAHRQLSGDRVVLLMRDGEDE